MIIIIFRSIGIKKVLEKSTLKYLASGCIPVLCCTSVRPAKDYAAHLRFWSDNARASQGLRFIRR